MTDQEALDFLAGKLGKDKAVADALGITPQRLNNWRDPSRGISADMRPVVWAKINDHGGNLAREWLFPRRDAA